MELLGGILKHGSILVHRGAFLLSREDVQPGVILLVGGAHRLEGDWATSGMCDFQMLKMHGLLFNMCLYGR